MSSFIPRFTPLSVFFPCCVNCFSFVASFLLSCCHSPEFHFNLTVLIDVLHSQNFNCYLFQMTLKHSPPFPPEFQAGLSHLLFLLSKRSAAPSVSNPAPLPIVLTSLEPGTRPGAQDWATLSFIPSIHHVSHRKSFKSLECFLPVASGICPLPVHPSDHCLV